MLAAAGIASVNVLYRAARERQRQSGRRCPQRQMHRPTLMHPPCISWMNATRREGDQDAGDHGARRPTNPH
jgi:hypothetical protein